MQHKTCRSLSARNALCSVVSYFTKLNRGFKTAAAAACQHKWWWAKTCACLCRSTGRIYYHAGYPGWSLNPPTWRSEQDPVMSAPPTRCSFYPRLLLMSILRAVFVCLSVFVPLTVICRHTLSHSQTSTALLTLSTHDFGLCPAILSPRQSPPHTLYPPSTHPKTPPAVSQLPPYRDKELIGTPSPN